MKLWITLSAHTTRELVANVKPGLKPPGDQVVKTVIKRYYYPFNPGIIKKRIRRDGLTSICFG